MIAILFFMFSFVHTFAVLLDYFFFVWGDVWKILVLSYRFLNVKSCSNIAETDHPTNQQTNLLLEALSLSLKGSSKGLFKHLFHTNINIRLEWTTNLPVFWQLFIKTELKLKRSTLIVWTSVLIGWPSCSREPNTTPTLLTECI